MPKILFLAMFLFLFLTRGVFADSGVAINEIAWMGSAASTADEWIELKNDGGSSADLSGWRLEWRNGEYGITFAPDKCANTVIPAGGYFLLERTNDDTVPGVAADCIYTGALSNSGERIVLKNTAGSLISEIDASSEWPAGDNGTKQTMQRQGAAWISATSTPKVQNQGAPVSPISAPQNSSHGSVPAPIPTAPSPSLRAYAGEDRTAVAGAVLDFIGEAQGPKDRPLENVRFWWNFGDGATREGRSVPYTFQIPGKYVIGLHVSVGAYASSDYLTVNVIPNQISVKSVVLGDDGFVKLVNPTDTDLDIGEWVLEDARGKKFIIPSKTKIGAKAEVAFPNRITGLLETSGGERVTLYYPNLVAAIKWEGKRVEPGAKTAVASGEPKAESADKKLAHNLTLEELPVADSLQETAGVSASGTSKLFLFIAAAIGLLASVGFLAVRKFYPWRSQKW